MKKQIIPYVSVYDQTVQELVLTVETYDHCGSDGICLVNYHAKENELERYLNTMKAIVKSIDLPVIIGTKVERFEDVKKAFYTGARTVLIQLATLMDQNVIKEAIKRFGCDSIMIDLSNVESIQLICEMIEFGVKRVLVNADQLQSKWMTELNQKEIEITVKTKNSDIESMNILLSQEIIANLFVENIQADQMMRDKIELKKMGIHTNTFESSMNFEEFKLDSKGLIPAIVQDYKTNEVLMLAYMNRESFERTIQTGCMTYYSRSRHELWIKGETSGHYQYVKELSIDCDRDTILAKVHQIGAACHTGNRSCFYTQLMKKEWDHTNPYAVFEEVYNVILDRKNHPKEGSYTNYLFDKGIDKILKKCGEEATEIVIAAKNPEVEELKYEISDFLYHCMVLMAERGVDWEDITKELAHRR